jgi:transposase
MHSKAAPRRRHDAELKAKVLTECDAAGASVAAVARSHDLNANLVHKWRRRREQRKHKDKTNSAAQPSAQAHDAGAAFIELRLPAPPPSPAAMPDIRIELRRGATSVNMVWPGASAGACAAWLREWLR